MTNGQAVLARELETSNSTGKVIHWQKKKKKSENLSAASPLQTTRTKKEISGTVKSTGANLFEYKYKKH